MAPHVVRGTYPEPDAPPTEMFLANVLLCEEKEKEKEEKEEKEKEEKEEKEKEKERAERIRSPDMSRRSLNCMW